MNLPRKWNLGDIRVVQEQSTLNFTNLPEIFYMLCCKSFTHCPLFVMELSSPLKNQSSREADVGRKESCF